MNAVFTIAKRTFKDLCLRKETLWLIAILNILLLANALIQFKDLTDHNQNIAQLAKQVRAEWDNNPEKHPHRMAHYGYVVFRTKHPLSFFDKGLDNYLGNAVFLEAHKQNTVNFSDDSLSDTFQSFGGISAAMLLQLLLTLVVFLWGHNLISKERRSGTLKLLISQGVEWKSIILGKTLGLFGSSLTIQLPVMILSAYLLYAQDLSILDDALTTKYGIISIVYFFYFLVTALFTVLISALVRSSKLSLTILMGCWLAFVMVLPMVVKVMGEATLYIPSRVEFDIAFEQEMLENGDSHNPNDPHFKALKDSLLSHYSVNTTSELPINYGGFVMKEGEKISSEVYNKHKNKLVDKYLKQQNFVKAIAILSPYMAIKNISMAITGTDYREYIHFENQAEDYRYFLAQSLNDLHIKHIANDVKSSADKKAALSSSYWKDIKYFAYQFRGWPAIIQSEMVSIIALLMWGLILFVSSIKFQKIFKVL